MIDKPKDKVGRFLERFFGWFEKGKSAACSKLSAPKNKAEKFKNAHPRLAASIVATICISAAGLVIVGFATPKTVIVNIDNSIETTTTKYETTSMRVDSFIESHEIDYVYGQDIIDVQMYDGISDEMEINITKALQIPVTADGKTITVTTLPVTVGELLEELEIKVGKDDIVEPAQNEMLMGNTHVYVRRVTTGYVSEEVSSEHKQIYAADYGMPIGKTAVTQEGQDGLEKRTYLVTYIDGKEAERELTETEILQEKQDKRLSYGMGILSGAPSGLQYKQKISGVKAVAYHYSGNPVGAYGLPCEYGTCAVDSSIIPLGSLLYIEGYGYAVANDVGTAIKGNTVDLYMEKYSQCLTWGARNVNVYIIEYGNNTRL